MKKIISLLVMLAVMSVGVLASESIRADITPTSYVWYNGNFIAENVLTQQSSVNMYISDNGQTQGSVVLGLKDGKKQNRVTMSWDAQDEIIYAYSDDYYTFFAVEGQTQIGRQKQDTTIYVAYYKYSGYVDISSNSVEVYTKVN